VESIMKKLPVRLVVALWALLVLAAVGQAITTEAQRAPAAAIGAAVDVQPPIGKDSVKFLVIGDSGTGDRAQTETGAQMWKAHSVFPYEFAIMLGDNMYGSERPQDYVSKFERPYKPLLDANISFYAALGNHDDPNQRYYKNFGMGGKRYYTYQKKDVRFFALDSNYMDQDQQRWLQDELSKSNSKWKIAYFHHPIYSSGGRHGSEVDLRSIVEPMFIKYNLNVVFAGHEHFYERLKPQKGINYFTAGGSAKLRSGDIVGNSALTAKGYDSGQSFMLVEIDGDVLRFQTISRQGKTVDSGEIRRTPTS
jgi:hypothetical protein